MVERSLLDEKLNMPEYGIFDTVDGCNTVVSEKVLR